MDLIAILTDIQTTRSLYRIPKGRLITSRIRCKKCGTFLSPIQESPTIIHKPTTRSAQVYIPVVLHPGRLICQYCHDGL